MAVFTNIPDSDLDPGSPITTDLMLALRGNDEFLFDESRGFILVEKKLVVADVTDLTFSSLVGDTDEVYRMIGKILMSSSGNVYTLEPNAITANQDTLLIYDSSTAGFRVVSTDLSLGVQRSSGEDIFTFDALFWARRDVNSVLQQRVMQSEFASLDDAGASAALTIGKTAGIWQDTATDITSLVLHSANALEILDGSTVALYKLRQS